MEVDGQYIFGEQSVLNDLKHKLESLNIIREQYESLKRILLILADDNTTLTGVLDELLGAIDAMIVDKPDIIEIRDYCKLILWASPYKVKHMGTVINFSDHIVRMATQKTKPLQNAGGGCS